MTALASPASPARFGFAPSAWDVLLLVLLNIVGLMAYGYPFVLAGTTEPGSTWFEHQSEGPLMMAGAAALALALIVAELSNGRLNAKSIAVLGVLAALAAAMRTVTLPAGANLYFFLVILGAWAFGPRLGFLLGALSFVLSAMVTGGLGPWLPFQMFAAAWMGLTAGAAGATSRRIGLGRRPELAAVVLFGGIWGLAYGAIVNLWFWPYWQGGPDLTFTPGSGPIDTLRTYGNFYVVSSLGWDLVRSVCNMVVLATLGAPMLRSLRRFQARFHFHAG